MTICDQAYAVAIASIPASVSRNGGIVTLDLVRNAKVVYLNCFNSKNKLNCFFLCMGVVHGPYEAKVPQV
jgi:hypothetical protein